MLALVGLRGLAQAPRLVSVVYLVISGVGGPAGFTPCSRATANANANANANRIESNRIDAPSPRTPLPEGAAAPAMLGTTFASLTARVGITIVSQIHVASLIAGELGMPRDLGKPSQPAAAPEAEHP